MQKAIIRPAAIIMTVIMMAEFLVSPAKAYKDNRNYMQIMISCAVSGDLEGGKQAADLRNEKIKHRGLDYTMINFDDLYLLSKIMYAEAGSEWLSDEWKLCVGEVVLNRVASPEFPNTIKEVLEQPGQYYGKNSAYFARILPSERCVRLAVRLLEGERHMIPSVVFQSNGRQGSGIHKVFYDTWLGWTYFGYSNYPAIYQ